MYGGLGMNCLRLSRCRVTALVCREAFETHTYYTLYRYYNAASINKLD